MKTIITTLTVAVAALAVAYAQDEEPVAAGDGLEEAEAVVGKAKKEQSGERPFFLLPLCRKLEGQAEVRKPGQAWEPIEEGKFYPLGSSYRTVSAESRLLLQLGRECEVEVVGIASFGSLAQQGLMDRTRTLVLDSGTIQVTLPRNFPEGLLFISAPGFKVVNPTGIARYTYTRTGDGDEALVRCVTGGLAVEGQHYRIEEMHAANEVRIRTSEDRLFTALYGTSGDYLVKLDQGLVATRNFETNEDEIAPKTLLWKLSPRTAVRIQRAVPAIGKRMSVTVMTFDASGDLRNRCTFCEGLHQLNTGEEGPVAKADKEALSKKLAESAGDTETVEAKPDEAEEKTEGEAPADSSDDF